MTEKEAREIVRLQGDDFKYFIAQGYLEAAEKARPLVEASRYFVSKCKGQELDFDETERMLHDIYGRVKTALSQWDEGQK